MTKIYQCLANMLPYSSAVCDYGCRPTHGKERTKPHVTHRTDLRPWARWYQLRGLPLVGSECVCPQCNSSFVITRESAKPSAFGLPSISQELTRNANRKSATLVRLNSPTVKCPRVRPQRYNIQLLSSKKQEVFDHHKLSILSNPSASNMS